jgi:hypothetical protein
MARKADGSFLFFLPSGTAFFTSFSGEEKEMSVGFPFARIQRGGWGRGRRVGNEAADGMKRMLPFFR